jgi:hypothetical protein
MILAFPGYFLSHILFQCFVSAVSMGIQDPDPAFYLNVDPNPDPDPGSQTNADPCGSGSWSDVAVTNTLVWFSPVWKAGNQDYLLLLVNFLAPWIRIRIPNSDQDLDPGDPNQCGFGLESLYYSVRLFRHFPGYYLSHYFKFLPDVIVRIINFLFGKIFRQFPSLSMKFFSLLLSNMSNNV